MSEALRLDLFAEDRAHEELLKPLIRRLGEEEDVELSVQVRSARGGHGRALTEFAAYQSWLRRGLARPGSADLIVVAIDGNCSTFTETKARIEQETRSAFRHRLVSACPDPHVERWFFADLDAFHNVVGSRPSVGTSKCEREYYKELLRTAVGDAGHRPTLGGVEFAAELVAQMDLYRAGKADRSLKTFVDDLRSALRALAAH